jgi:hypothetical protein
MTCRAGECVGSATGERNDFEAVDPEPVENETDVVGPTEHVPIDVRGGRADAGPVECDEPDAQALGRDPSDRCDLS